uniref:Putative secreted protein n=1 Tax=Ixodes ricinus TaxID=34613 RepID=A0A6B0UJJ7_IXORI
MPNSIRSRASTPRSRASRSALSSLALECGEALASPAWDAARRPGESSTGAPNPRYFSLRLLPTMRSRPLKAPDATKRMLAVSTVRASPRSLRELRSGTLTKVPSSIFSMPC